MYSASFLSRSMSEASSARRTWMADCTTRPYSSSGSRVEKIVRLSSNSPRRSRRSRRSSALLIEKKRSCRTTGLTRKSKAPCRRLSMALSIVPCAVMMMISMSGLIALI